MNADHNMARIKALRALKSNSLLREAVSIEPRLGALLVEAQTTEPMRIW